MLTCPTVVILPEEGRVVVTTGGVVVTTGGVAVVMGASNQEITKTLINVAFSDQLSDCAQIYCMCGVI